MGTVSERAATTLAAVFVTVIVALQLAGGSAPAVVLAGLAVATVITAVSVSIVVVACISALAASDSLGARSRNWRHRQALRQTPAPQHPDTDGRPRSRAPSLLPAAT